MYTVCVRTQVGPAALARVVAVLQAAGPLLQAGAGRAAVGRLPLHVAAADPRGETAGLSTAAPVAPRAHQAVLSYRQTDRYRQG